MSEGEFEPVSSLTERQKEILRLVGEGYTSKEIARHLGLSFRTVDTHILRMAKQLNAPSRAEAARMLADFETKHKIRKYPERLPNAANPGLSEPVTSQGWRSALFRLFALPPLGGRTNDLGWDQKTIHVFRIAAMSLATVTGLALAIAGVMHTFS
jgi:DNA-binding CsgD family transcriptional regulator